jgi:hypothetical protein
MHFLLFFQVSTWVIPAGLLFFMKYINTEIQNFKRTNLNLVLVTSCDVSDCPACFFLDAFPVIGGQEVQEARNCMIIMSNKFMFETIDTTLQLRRGSQGALVYLTW